MRCEVGGCELGRLKQAEAVKSEARQKKRDIMSCWVRIFGPRDIHRGQKEG